MGIYGWHDNDLKVYNLEVDGTLTFGDAATDNLVIKGRVSSLTAAGSAIQITSSYAHGEGIEMRYQVTDWTGVGSSFKGLYLRSEAITTAASGKSIYGAEVYGVCNNVTMTTGSLWGALFYAYVKGVGAVTVNNMYAVQGELTWDASRTGDCTITTAAACFRAKITGGRVADYTKIHGYELTIGEMDGDSATFGKGLFMQDDSGMSGTCTLTTGIDIAIGCATGISITNATTVGLSIAAGAMGFDLTSTMAAGAAANANEINLTDNSTGSSGYARALWINATVAGDKTGSGEHNSLGIDQSVTGNTPYLYGLTYYSADVGDPTIGFAAPISVYQDDLGSNLGAYVCIDLGVALSNAPTDRYHYMRFRDHSTAIPTSVFRFEGGHCASYLFDTTGGTGTPDFITTNAGQTPAADGVLIAINYHGTPYYIKAASAWS